MITFPSLPACWCITKSRLALYFGVPRSKFQTKCTQRGHARINVAVPHVRERKLQFTEQWLVTVWMAHYIKEVKWNKKKSRDPAVTIKLYKLLTFGLYGPGTKWYWAIVLRARSVLSAGIAAAVFVLRVFSQIRHCLSYVVVPVVRWFTSGQIRISLLGAASTVSAPSHRRWIQCRLTSCRL